MHTIDGSRGEGGGQVLRTALAASLATGIPFRITDIRGKRHKPGLLRQHLTGVRAAVAISDGAAQGAELRSRELTFSPGKVRSGAYEFSVGTAGSTGLVLQTVLVPLLLAAGDSEVVLEGGTHNPMSPPFEFLSKSFLPLLAKMGAEVSLRLERHGFYPAGGGRVRLMVGSVNRLSPINLVDRGEIRSTGARALVSNLPPRIAERELDVVAHKLGWNREQLEVVCVEAAGPGNVLLLEVESGSVTEVCTGFGEAQLRAEAVASRACDSIRRYLAAGAPVGRHLADQLLLPMALGGGGSFRTTGLSRHSETNIELIRELLGVDISISRKHRNEVVVTLSPS